MVYLNPVDMIFGCQVTIWLVKYKRKHTSCLWLSLSQEHLKSTERGGYCFAEGCTGLKLWVSGCPSL